MVLIGYPPQKITILTTYNGQKYLIRDIFHQKCHWNPLFKRPKITTVDKYQGQQNDYVLLSLVRTNSVGHIRDPRRLVVAMSRTRFGLYVFGRFDLYYGCYDIRNTVRKFAEKPLTLELVRDERFKDKRQYDEIADNSKVRQVSDFREMYEIVQNLLKG